MEIRSKHVLITGATKRLGRAMADCLLSEGARLSAHYHTAKDEALLFERSASQKGLAVRSIEADLRQSAAAVNLVKKAVAEFGPIDILVNSASLFYPTPAHSAQGHQWAELLSCNLTSLFFLCQTVHNTQPEGGVIVNLADVYAERALPGYAAYSATK
ncbi:MAG: SDR family NAD(P)-dependent oxidoreductase, partial [Bdellovibrionales bacterium]|nr:SDR family NAD(P)-dependent oxidoreductase [Bdellovibrionales bacterium]